MVKRACPFLKCYPLLVSVFFLDLFIGRIDIKSMCVRLSLVVLRTTMIAALKRSMTIPPNERTNNKNTTTEPTKINENKQVTF